MGRLADESWQPVSRARALLALLRAEWDKHAAVTRWIDRRIITEPDIADTAQASVREAALQLVRGRLLAGVPADTKWHAVRWLQPSHYGELRVIAGCEWDASDHRNELPAVARQAPLALKASPREWPAVLLWGHSEEGPFTILEGNHRMIALASLPHEQRPPRMQCFVGLSREPSRWHIEDAPRIAGKGQVAEATAAYRPSR